jgi:hypothetical protein
MNASTAGNVRLRGRLEQDERGHRVRRVQGQLHRDVGARRVPDDVGTRHSELAEELARLRGLIDDAHRSIGTRAAAIADAVVADHLVVREAGLEGEGQEPIGEHAGVDEEDR